MNHAALAKLKSRNLLHQWRRDRASATEREYPQALKPLHPLSPQLCFPANSGTATGLNKGKQPEVFLVTYLDPTARWEHLLFFCGATPRWNPTMGCKIIVLPRHEVAVFADSWMLRQSQHFSLQEAVDPNEPNGPLAWQSLQDDLCDSVVLRSWDEEDLASSCDGSDEIIFVDPPPGAVQDFLEANSYRREQSIHVIQHGQQPPAVPHPPFFIQWVPSLEIQSKTSRMEFRQPLLMISNPYWHAFGLAPPPDENKRPV